jgi:hypothetical protein
VTAGRCCAGAAALWLCATTGCAADLGLGGGAMTNSGNKVALGRISLTTKPTSTPINDQGLLVGVALEERDEEHLGSRFMLGAVAGYGLRPYAVCNTFSAEFYAEGGTFVRPSLFEHKQGYVGAGAGLPFPIDKQRNVSDVNRSTWILKPRFEIVPFFRFRTARDLETYATLFKDTELSGGVAVRYRIVSDLF